MIVTNSITLDEIRVSTTTIIATTNLVIDMDRLFEALPIYTLHVPDTCQSKTDFKGFIQSQSIPNGSIVTLEYNGQQRGYKLPKRNKSPPVELPLKKHILCPGDDRVWMFAERMKSFDPDQFTYIPDLSQHDSLEALTKHAQEQSSRTKRRRYFRNTITVVMMAGDKLINFKVPKQGKLQLTGCTHPYHAKICIEQLWSHIQSLQSQYPDMVHLTGSSLVSIMRTVMTDVVFHFGFEINRERLDSFINQHTWFNSLLETSFGYTGVNIKVPFELRNTPIPRYTCTDNGWVEDTILYNDYLDALPEREQVREQTKRRYNTFLVFYSGTTIMSGMQHEYMHEIFQVFIRLILNARPLIEEIIQR
jgi:hypothetical protein